MSTASSNTTREIKFALGSFGGIFIFALGFAFYILALSKGLREEQGGYLPDVLEITMPVLGLNLLTTVGLIPLVVGALVSLYTSRLPENLQRFSGYLSRGLMLVGFGVASFGFSPQTTVSAPYLATTPVPVSIVPVLVGMGIFPFAQLSRLTRGDRYLSKRAKRSLVWLALALVFVGILPSTVYVFSLLTGATGPEAAAVFPVPTVVLDGATQKVVLFVIALELMIVGYAILKTSAKAVGW